MRRIACSIVFAGLLAGCADTKKPDPPKKTDPPKPTATTPSDAKPDPPKAGDPPPKPG